MIPALLIAVVVAGCGNDNSSEVSQVTVESRRAAIDSAMEHLNSGRVNEALAIVSTLESKDSKSPQTQETYATILLASSLNFDKEGNISKGDEHRQRALDAFIAACKYSSAPGLLQLSTAQLAQMLGNTEVAKKYYKLAHASNTADGRSAFFLTQLFLLNKEWKEAQHWVQESLLRDPNEPFTILSSALIEAELGNLTKATELAAKGCEILPNEPTLRFMQARVIRLSGSPVQALEIILSLPKDMLSTPLVKEEQNLCLTQIEVGEH